MNMNGSMMQKEFVVSGDVNDVETMVQTYGEGVVERMSSIFIWGFMLFLAITIGVAIIIGRRDN